MRIIKEGKKSFTTICPKCGCEFEYEVNEILFNYVNCPCCDERILHKNQSIQFNPIDIKFNSLKGGLKDE